jgi:hypothetical protein
MVSPISRSRTNHLRNAILIIVLRLNIVRKNDLPSPRHALFIAVALEGRPAESFIPPVHIFSCLL